MHKKGRRGLVFSLIFAVLILSVLIRFFFFSPGVLEHISSYIVYPFLRVQYLVVTPVKSFFERRRSFANLEQAFQKVQTERDELLAELIQLRAMINYQEETQELVAFAKRYDAHALLAQVLMKQFTEQSHYLLLDKGTHHGVKPEMVAVYENNLLGKIVEAYPYYSKLQLITDKACNVAVYCSQTGASGIHEGINRCDQTTLQYVSHLAKVQEGDLLLSSGQGLIFPKGFALGKIASAKKNALYYDITVEPFANLHTVSHCYIIQKGMYAEVQNPATELRTAEVISEDEVT